jgi:diguanylate cyclase (GGDEF)-like protein
MTALSPLEHAQLPFAAPSEEEVLCSNERTRVVRLRLPGGRESVVCKQPLGPDAGARLRQEHLMLQRLVGVAGVSQLAAGVALLPNTLVLQDVAGVPLASLLRDGPVPVARILQIAVPLAHAVAAMHRRGIVHRDINPANILVSGPSHQPTLIDFNLASSFAEERPGFTHPSQVVGTLAYLAPEQTGRTGRAVDQRADLYALGATLYELAAGRPPFDDGDPLQLICDHLTRVPARPSQLDPRVPEGLSDIVLHLLDKEPDRRYQSAEGLLHDLTRLQALWAARQDTRFPLGEQDFAARLAPASRLVGRDTEILALRTALDDALHTPRRGLLVGGAPGVGKTALVNELRPLVTARGGWFVAGKFDQYRSDASSGAVTQALRALGRLLLAEPAAELELQRARLLEALGRNAGLMTAALPEFALLLGPQPEPKAADPVQAELCLLQATLDLLRSLVSPARPLVMVLDDIQWAGAVSLRLIERVLSDPSLRGLLLLCAYRDAEAQASPVVAGMLQRWSRLQPAPRQLQLRNLPQAHLGELLAEMMRLPPARAAELADAVGALTDGNPYDTVELVNALRRDGVLSMAEGGWTWDAAAIRRFVGQGSVVDLLATRIGRLPEDSRTLLQVMACLGGTVELACLQAAAAATPAVLEDQLRPVLEDGLLVMEAGSGGTLRFRHDRVQQAAHGGLDAAQRSRLHWVLGERLAAQADLQPKAAEQYLSCVEVVQEPADRLRVARLLREHAAGLGRSALYAAAERYLSAARTLLLGLPAEAGVADLGPIDVERHAALYNLGRLDEADSVYLEIQARCTDPLDVLEATCVQISSLANRGRPQDAVGLGLALLRQLGITVPEVHTGAEIGPQLDALCQWVKKDQQFDRRLRPETRNPVVLAAARILNRLQAPAFFCDMKIVAWLVLESQRLWAAHGPCPALVANLSRASLVTIEARQDYRTGFEVVRHALATSAARGYEPETSQARHLFAISTCHWFEPLEAAIQQAQHARVGLLQGGDVQSACFTYRATLPALLDSAPTLDTYAAEIEAGMALATRTGNGHATAVNLADRQLLRMLRGQTRAPGSLDDSEFDSQAHLAGLAANPMAVAAFHLRRALGAALLDDLPALGLHAGAAMPLLGYIQGFYPTAHAHVLQALALAGQARTAAPDDAPDLLAKLDACRGWLARRAADAPANFSHLLALVDAERAQAAGDFRAALAAYDKALRDAAQRQRPWHRALITERAALFHLAHGLVHTGRELLAAARDLYDDWGATAKVQALEQGHRFLQARRALAARRSVGSGLMSSDTIDLMAVLRASQALSSETSVERLQGRVRELLGAMTGATAVSVATWHDDEQEWQVLAPLGAGGTGLAVPVAEAGARGWLPLSAFRYVERTRQPLLVDDATCDDRFARDPYFQAQAQCSLLLVPIDSQGAPRLILLLENRLSASAFSASRLDAVMLIAGQLAVSLDNALLYASLERKVAERTDALEEANRRLALLSVTDPLTGLANRRRFAEVLDAEWRRALRPAASIALAMIDIDQFKLYNDRQGHLAGDACLQRVATALKASLRLASDFVARYGGEEFVLVLPGTDAAGAWATCDRLRAEVAALALPHEHSVHGIVTISIGLTAVIPSAGARPEQYLQIADAALYEAKSGGRNRVVEK